MKILIVEDHPKLRKNIKTFLLMKSYLVESAIHWEEALKKLSITSYDCIVLDINMPIMDGRSFIKNIRNKDKYIPVIALTSNSMLEDKLEMFNLWVDDYLTKPFELKELEVRINSLLKRKDKKIENIINIWKVKIDLLKHKIYFSNKQVKLGNKEYMIIEYLAKSKWYPKSKISILEAVWWEFEENLDLSSTTLETHISFIRKKLWKDFIKTIKGVGYTID